MRLNKLLPFVFLCFVAILLGAAVTLRADDPLNAFPTAEDPVEDRVRRLTEDELKAIQLPENGEQRVLSIAIGPPLKGQDIDPAKIKEWLHVYADGRIDCESLSPLSVERGEDKLTDAELKWLLHLAVNECAILGRTTEAIAKDTKGRELVKGEPQRNYRYQIELSAGQNELLIPEIALVLRPLRARMELGAFASLNKYSLYLVSRSYLGNEAERDALLSQLNRKLQAERPEVPEFRLEHLGLASIHKKGIKDISHGLSAVFMQEVDLGNDRSSRVMGIVRQKEKGGEFVVTISGQK